jgi:acetyl esterase/lipase
MITGGADPVVPPQFGARYAARARAAGDDAAAIVVPAQGHAEEVAR